MGADKATVVDIILEFLQSFIHQILYVRKIYASQLFESKRLYGVAVQKSRHPDLSLYITEAVESLKEPLSLGTLAQVGVVVLSSDRHPLEQFIVEPTILLSSYDHHQVSGREIGFDDMLQIEAQLRSIMLKVQYIDALLPYEIPESSTFEIVAYVSKRNGMDISLWSEDGKEATVACASKRLEKAEITPLKTCLIDRVFRLQTFIETSATNVS